MRFLSHLLSSNNPTELLQLAPPPPSKGTGTFGPPLMTTLAGLQQLDRINHPLGARGKPLSVYGVVDNPTVSRKKRVLQFFCTDAV